MSEQAEATRPTANEETETEASPPRAAEASEAEAQSTAPSSEASSDPDPTKNQPQETADAPQAEAKSEAAPKEEARAEAKEEAQVKAKVEAQADSAATKEATDGKGATAPAEAQEEASETKAETEAETEAETKTETKAQETKAEEAKTEGGEVAEAGAATTADPSAKAEPTEDKSVDTKPADTKAADTKAVEDKAPEDKAAQAKEAQADEGDEAKKKEPKPLTEEEKARLAEIEGLRQAKEDQKPVKGRVIGWNQGGFHVVIGTITTFCPRSEMELKNPKSPNYYLDKELEFYVIKHQKKGKRIVVSRKQLLEEERAEILESMKETLVPGKDLEGSVSSITDFGAFVDVGGGIEGLVHITELSNRRIKHPRDFVQLGQDVKVRVLKVEEDGERISLSMKALEPNPYEDFAEEHPRGSKFQGKVVRKTDFGIFVELLPGLDGMIHISQLPPGMSQDDESLEVGKEVAGWVIRVEPKRERISLSLKEVPSEDPWKSVQERYPEGSVVEGQVEDVAPFGVFIQLEPGLTGLLPNSEMNLPRGQDRSKHFPPGKKVEIQVASVDPQRKRISLVPEGAQIEGSRSDYRDYMKQQKRQTEGMTAMAAAFAKLKDQDQDQAGE